MYDKLKDQVRAREITYDGCIYMVDRRYKCIVYMTQGETFLCALNKRPWCCNLLF